MMYKHLRTSKLKVQTDLQDLSRAFNSTIRKKPLPTREGTLPPNGGSESKKAS